jgi:imidazolonepropionase-like amidohydrolase
MAPFGDGRRRAGTFNVRRPRERDLSWMTLTPRLLLAIAILPLNPANAPAQSSPALAIERVNAVSMEGERVDRDMTVVVRDGRVVAYGPARSTPVPPDARRIDGRGRWVIPGLADMHAHLFADDYVGDAAAPAELGLFLAHGVTTVRLQIGRPLHLDLRRRVREGTLAGPRLWVSSPMLSGDSAANTLRVRTADEGRAAVRAAHRDGYDLIKLTTNITPEVFDAVMTEARAIAIRVTGHVDPRVGAPRAIAAGLQVEHLDNYMETVLADSAPSRVSVSDVGAYRAANWASLAHVDEGKLEALAGATARAGVRVTPTLAFFKSWFATRHTDDEVRARPEYGMLPATYRNGWERSRAAYWRNPPSDAQRARYIALRDRMVRAIVDSGGAVMAGSDGPSALMSYGWLLHRELEALVAAGLSPYEALRAATVVPAAYLGVGDDQGSIAVGKRADLVLTADPLADIRATSAIAGVVVAGRYHDSSAREALIEAARTALTSAPAPAGAPPTAPGSTAPSSTAPTEEQQVLAVVQRLFDAMRTKDTASMRTLFDPEARLFGMRPGRDGTPVVQRLTAAEFAAFVARDQRAPWVERAFFPEVRITGTLATVWAEYDFHFGTTFSHCGTDAVQLLRTPDGWKIVSLADTFVREGCPSRSPP